MRKLTIIEKLSLVIVCLWFISFRWPVDNGRITSTFGETRGDHFHDGVDMISYDKKVYPMADGEVLYAWSKGLFPLEEYTGSGNYIILKHKENICSNYVHMEDFSSIEESYSQHQSLGLFANTGRSYGNHIHFTFFNLKTFDSYNSFLYNPPMEDLIKPEIGNFAIKLEDRIIILRDKSDIRLTKHYPMLVKISDSIKKGDNLGVYRLKVEFNNGNVLDIDFDKLEYTKNGLTVEKKDFHNLYESGYYKIPGLTYKSGENHFKITAYDYAGNFSTKELTLNIFLDM